MGSIVVPELSESVVDATVSEWLKGEGDSVEVGDILVVLETDKVSLEVAAEETGILAKITRGEGEDVQPGEVLGEIGGGNGASASSESKQEQKNEATVAVSATEVV